jgi:hypothetical protein
MRQKADKMRVGRTVLERPLKLAVIWRFLLGAGEQILTFVYKERELQLLFVSKERKLQ